MIQTSECRIEIASAHIIGNKHNEEPLTFSEQPLTIEGEELDELLKSYFLDHFKEPDFQSFAPPEEGELEEHDLYAFAKKVFSGEGEFHTLTKEVARLLYDNSEHPNIKSGELYVVLFRDLVVEDELTDAVGIFKSEIKQYFLQMENNVNLFSLNFDMGINPQKLDKGCLILNLSEATGYRCCVIDKSSRGEEARYWKEHFLNVKPRPDNYHFTQDVMKVTKKFVTSKKMKDAFEMEPTDQADFLNSSVKYFNNNETFNEEEYANEIFKDDNIAQGFQEFRQSYQEANEMPAAEEFDISAQAVKKQSRSLKSVLKLDKNFHVYVHGDRQLIEKGYDEMKGKSFYKIYFDEER